MDIRPEWHKYIGAALVVAGIVLFIVCENDGWHIHEYGGHVWYVVAVLLASSSTWWLGVFDLET
jgi:hypothetical protein